MADPVIVGEDPSGGVIVDLGDGQTITTTPEAASANGVRAAAAFQRGAEALAAGRSSEAAQYFEEANAAQPNPVAAQRAAEARQLSAFEVRPEQPQAHATPVAPDAFAMPAMPQEQVGPVEAQAREAQLRQFAATPVQGAFNDPQPQAQPAPFQVGRPRGGGGGGRVRVPGPSPVEGRIADTFAQEQGALDVAAEGIREGAEQRAQAMREAAARDAQMAAQQAEAEAARQAELEKSERSLAQMREAFAAKRIDPQAFWQDAGDAGRITAALALAVGEFSKVLTGSDSNPALTIINDAVERNVEAQMQNLAKEEGELSAASGDLQRLMSQFGDDRQREAALRLQHWENVDRQLQALSANVTDQTTLANIAQTQAQIERQKEQTALQFEQARQEAAARAAARRAAAGRRRANTIILPGGLEMTLDPNDPEKFRDQMRMLQQAGIDTGPFSGLGADGGMDVADLEGADRRKLAEAQSAYLDFTDALDNLQAIREQAGAFGGEILDRDLVARGQAEQARLIRTLSRMAQTGVMSVQEYERMREQVPDPTEFDFIGSVLGDEASARYEQLRQDAQSTRDSAFRAYGVNPPGDTQAGPALPASARPIGGGG